MLGFAFAVMEVKSQLRNRNENSSNVFNRRDLSSKNQYKFRELHGRYYSKKGA
jgi:hypothetical protein